MQIHYSICFEELARWSSSTKAHNNDILQCHYYYYYYFNYHFISEVWIGRPDGGNTVKITYLTHRIQSFFCLGYKINGCSPSSFRTPVPIYNQTIMNNVPS